MADAITIITSAAAQNITTENSLDAMKFKINAIPKSCDSLILSNNTFKKKNQTINKQKY